MITFKLPQQAADNPFEIHALESLPKPYPSYPTLITRTIYLNEAQAIEKLYGVSKLPPTRSPTKDSYLAYDLLTDKIAREGENSLDAGERAFLQFANVLYCFCYDKHRRGGLEADLKLIWKIRRTRGALLRHEHELENVMTRDTLDRGQVDLVLEDALQRNDYAAIRAILNYEGYEVPVDEPNDLVVPAELDDNEFDISDDLKIHITPEEYKMWKAPLMKEDLPNKQSYWQEQLANSEMSMYFLTRLRTSMEGSVEKSVMHEAIAEAMAGNISLRLERLIRQRDIAMLRMTLRLYGHDIFPNSVAI